MIDTNLLKDIYSKIDSIPAFKTLNVQIESISEGMCIAIVPHDQNFDGVFKSYHGGMLMTAADTIALVALLTKTGTKANFATTDMNIRFMRPCYTDVKVIAQVVKSGKTLSLMQVELFDLNDKLVALAQVNYIQMNSD